MYRRENFKIIRSTVINLFDQIQVKEGVGIDI